MSALPTDPVLCHTLPRAGMLSVNINKPLHQPRVVPCHQISIISAVKMAALLWAGEDNDADWARPRTGCDIRQSHRILCRHCDLWSGDSWWMKEASLGLRAVPIKTGHWLDWTQTGPVAQAQVTWNVCFCLSWLPVWFQYKWPTNHRCVYLRTLGKAKEGSST